MLFSCQGYLLSNDQTKHEVNLIVSNQGLTINMTSNNSQIAFLPRGSTDSVLSWFRCVNESEQTGTMDLENLEKQIKVPFEVKLNNLIKLEQLLRGRLVYQRKPCFKIISELAPQIFLLQIEGTNNLYAEKVAFFPQNLKDKYNFARLDQVKQEQMILNNLRDFPHPNIIKIEEITTNGVSLSVILEYCSGGDLLKYLNQKNITPDIKKILKKLLEGIKHLHSLDILHRDLKLQNIYLKYPNDCDSVVIADFGLSCYKSQIQYYNPRCGTPGYTAPEVFDQNSIYDSKVDIFSLGVMFFNLLTLKNPFGSSRNPQELIKKNILAEYEHCHLEPLKLSHPQAYDLVTLMLQKDPKNRPTAIQCLQHPYFNEQSMELKEESTFDLIQQYRTKTLSTNKQKSLIQKLIRCLIRTE